jgi:hypothetical protein
MGAAIAGRVPKPNATVAATAAEITERIFFTRSIVPARWRIHKLP